MGNISRRKRTSKYLRLIGVVMISTILTACGARDEAIIIANRVIEQEAVTSNADSEDEVQESTPDDDNPMETEPEENALSDTNAKDEIDIFDVTSENEIQEQVPNDDGSMEIYSAREIISLSDDMIVGQVPLADILEGNPILYDRAIIDGFVVEWILTDYEDEDNYFAEEGILLISKENNAKNTQVIRVQGEGGGWGPPASLANKFEYMDVNFDDIPDLLICTGHHGNQGAVIYYCFLQTDAGFVEAPTFTEILNPSIDVENKLILSQWRNTAVSHSWAEYKYQDDAYALERDLCEYAEVPEDGKDASDYIWVWTVNGEVIGRSDELSESEIVDLLYSENSEWRIADDRWRTIYNHGLTADYSIYSEP